MEKSKNYKRQRKIRQKIFRLEKHLKIGPFKLDTPYQSGWNGTYGLRYDVSRRKDADFFRWLLPYINSTVHSRTHDFVITEFWNNCRKSLIPGLKTIRDRDFEKLQKDKKYGSKLAGWFFPIYKHNAWHGSYTVYEFKFPWMFVWEKSPHYVTHYYELQGHIAAEIDELEKEFDALGGWNTYLYFFHGSVKYYDDGYKKMVKNIKSAGLQNRPTDNCNRSFRNELKRETREILKEVSHANT